MKLIYVAPIGLFDDWAHTVQIMKMCEAFAKNGAEVELVVPDRKVSNNGVDPKKADPYAYNNVEKVFKITRLPFLDLFYSSPNRVFYFVRLITFLLSAKVYLSSKKYDALYTREIYTRLFFKRINLELHKFPKNLSSYKKFVFKSAQKLITLTSHMKKKLEELGVNTSRIVVAHDAVRLEDFSPVSTKTDSREKFGINQDDHLFGYIGTLRTFNMEKGVSTAISALEFLPGDYKLFVVGGEPVDVSYYKGLAESKKLSDRVIFAGRVSQKDISKYISACDVLVAPFPKTDHYEYYMSPLKIFEYMAGRRPMVVTDLTSLREILKDNETALFVPPENPKALADSIKKLIEDRSLSEKLISNAYKEVSEKYTWNKRAEAIIKFIS